MTQISHIFDKKQQKNDRKAKKVARNRNLYYIYIIMTRQSFLAALFGALLSTAAFAVSPLPLYTIETVTDGDMPIIQFSVVKDGGSLAIYSSIQPAIDFIRADATNVGTNFFAIQFETGTKVLDIGKAMSVTFEGGTGKINLLGKITSASGGSMADGPAGTVIIKSGISVESFADIENTMNGNAISVAGGQVKIVGGTVKANSGNAIDFPITSGGGSVVLGGSPTITGNIQVRTGALSVVTDPPFAPVEKQYTLLIYGAAGGVAVGGGANFLSNFTLDARSGNLILEKSGNDLVLATPSNSSSSNCGLVECLHSSSSSADEISSSSEESIAPIAHYTSPAAHSEIPTYYTIKGEPVGSIKPAKPGVYLVKQGNSVRKIAVR